MALRARRGSASMTATMATASATRTARPAPAASLSTTTPRPCSRAAAAVRTAAPAAAAASAAATAPHRTGPYHWRCFTCALRGCRLCFPGTCTSTRQCRSCNRRINSAWSCATNPNTQRCVQMATAALPTGATRQAMTRTPAAVSTRCAHVECLACAPACTAQCLCCTCCFFATRACDISITSS
jgi:hypothetical protein